MISVWDSVRPCTDGSLAVRDGPVVEGVLPRCLPMSLSEVCRRKDVAGTLSRRLENDMVETEWPTHWQSASRIELRAAAINLASRGWPVFPGTCPENKQMATGGVSRTRLDQTGPVPVHEDWRQWIDAPPNHVASWWTDKPYSVLVATGTLLDAVEVDDALGRRAATLLRAARRPAPIVATPNRRWFFLTATSNGLPASLAGETEIQWHSVESWVPLPPTPWGQGAVHWRVQPEIWGWRLPHADVVHDVLEQALSHRHPRCHAGRSVTTVDSAA